MADHDLNAPAAARAADHAAPVVIDQAWTQRQLDRNLNRVLNPAVCQQAIDAIKRPDTDFGAIAATLQGDPFIAVKVVGLARLMRRGGDPTVTSIQRAVALLGIRRVRALVMAVMLAGPLLSAPGSVARRKDLWRWVFGCAAAGDLLGKALAPDNNASNAAGDREYLVQGLLLGLGALILQAGLGRAYDRTLGVTLRPLRLAQREQRTLGATHHHVTLWALQAMRCPAEFGELSQALVESRDDEAALRARAIEMLGARAAGLETGQAEAWLVDALPRLGLGESFLDESLGTMRTRVRELTRVFDADLGGWRQQHETRQEILMLAGRSIEELLEEQAAASAHAPAA